MIMIILGYIVMGCFLEGIGMVLITVPVFQPIIMKFGYDPIWFAIIVVIMVEVGLIHPPVGMNLFVIQAQAPDVKITSIYRGIIPFLVAPLLLIVLLFLFPGLALWLPACSTASDVLKRQLFHAISISYAFPCETGTIRIRSRNDAPIHRQTPPGIVRALRLHPRRSPAARLHGCHARGACPRRRTLCAGELAPAFAGDRSPALPAGPMPRSAVEVIRPFVGDTISEADLSRLAREAYGTFRHPAVVPIAQFGASTFLLELFHGPTLAFKDVAMQLLARLMDHALAARGERTTIVVATSGDTGGAAVEAFRGRERADLFVLFPQGRISDVQRRMMTTANDNNVHALAVEGTFDDCQALVKGLFNHHAFRDRVRLSGVNSINWARIVAQVVYYFTAAATLGAPHRKVAFTVPTGNFGDVFAGYVAERMGLPVDRLVIATNVNDILARTLATGTYDLREVVATSSPSMDIQVSSNFERLLFEAYRARCRRRCAR